MFNLIMFIISTIGMCQIVIEGSIMEGFRNIFRKFTVKIGHPSFGNLVSCPLCFGMWSGLIMGVIWISFNPFCIFACGCAGSFLCNFTAIMLNYIEAATIINLPDQK